MAVRRKNTKVKKYGNSPKKRAVRGYKPYKFEDDDSESSDEKKTKKLKPQKGSLL